MQKFFIYFKDQINQFTGNCLPCNWQNCILILMITSKILGNILKYYDWTQ